jgi:hypothetical protein
MENIMSTRLPEIFERFENDLTKEILGNDDPFLCLFTEYMGQTTRDLVIKQLRVSKNPLKSLIDNFWYFPAILSVTLIDRLLLGVGRNGYFEVYPILEDMLGVSLHSTNSRIDLWQAFRKSCIRLGLEVSARKGGTHFMVEEYLRQAGLPLTYFPKFIDRAIRYANEVGLPEEDDDESLTVWQKGLVGRLNSPFPLVAKKAIERDKNNYYSKLFTRLYQQPPQNIIGLTLLERIILDSIKAGPQLKKIKRLSIPEIIIRDLEYGVLLPGGKTDGNHWILNIDGKEVQYTTYGEDRFVPFASLLWKKVVIKHADTRWEHTLWEDQKNNRFLIFSLPAGRLVRGASLADQEIYLDPGDYALLLRFRPADEENLEMFSDSPELYLRKVSVLPGAILSIQRGPVTTLLYGNDIPSLTWGRVPLRGVKGNEVFPSKSLSVQTYIPLEYLEKTQEYTLTVRACSLGELVDIHFNTDQGSAWDIALEQYLRSWKPGVSRIVIELHTRGSLKILARKSALVWNGLIEAEKRILFRCSSMPANLDKAQCVNVNADMDRKLLTFKDETNRFFKFSFIDGNISRCFTWAVPGIFINLVTYHEESVEERSLRLGSVLPVSKFSRKNIQIFASFPAILQLGEYIADVDFSRVGSKILPLASLLEYTSSGNNSLFIINKETGSKISLIELVTPSTVEKYTLESGNGINQACFQTLEKIQGIRITAANMVENSRLSVEFNCNAGDIIEVNELVPGIKVSSHFLSEQEVSCYFSTKCWPEGFWLISYHLKVNSQWGIAMNKNSEEIVDSVLSSPVEYATTPEEIIKAFCSSSTIQQKVVSLVTIHKAMMSRFAEECWPRVSWLKSYWNTLCTRYVRFVEDGQLWGELLRLATEWPEEAIAEGHVTTSILSGYLLYMFCFNRSFVPIKGNINNSLLSCMASFSILGEISRLFTEPVVDIAVLFGFGNAALVSTLGENPRRFSMQKYCQAMKSCHNPENCRLLTDDQWLPASGSFLGPLHYRYAIRRLKYRYLRSLSVISERRGRVLGMVKQMGGSDLSDFTENMQYKEFATDIDLGLFVERASEEEFLSDQDVVTQEHLEKIVRFISLLAQVCRAQARTPGIMKIFLNELQKKCDMSNNKVSGNLGYLLFLAEDLFAFYLMLWEVVFTADVDCLTADGEVEKTESRSSRRVYVRN